MVDSKERAWRIEKRIILKGWQLHDCIVATFDEAIAQAGSLLNSDECIYQVRFAQIGQNINSGYYIPQWDEEITLNATLATLAAALWRCDN